MIVSLVSLYSCQYFFFNFKHFMWFTDFNFLFLNDLKCWTSFHVLICHHEVCFVFCPSNWIVYYFAIFFSFMEQKFLILMKFSLSFWWQILRTLNKFCRFFHFFKKFKFSILFQFIIQFLLC